jgi:hypothetical protein
VRSSRCAAIGVVAEGMDVETALGIRIMVLNVPSYSGLGVLIGLLQYDGAGDLRITTEDSDCVSSVS